MDQEDPLQSSSSPKDITMHGSSISPESLLSYPAASSSTENPPPSVPVQPRQLLKDRLYVGNLHPTVDEYTLLQVFSKFGKISKLDFLFHKSGPMRGKPRGYAFVEYSDADDATKALVSANDKLLRGRKLIVTFAHQAPLDEYGCSKSRRAVNDTGKPTTLSLLKSTGHSRSDVKTEDKIAKMEAKLRQMGQSHSESRAHPSLPPKPVELPAGTTPGTATPSMARSRGKTTQKATLPSLPIVSRPVVLPTASNWPPSSLQTQPLKAASHRRGGPALTGVKIVKPKNP